MKLRGYDIHGTRHRTRFRDTRLGMAIQLIALFIAGYLVALELFR